MVAAASSRRAWPALAGVLAVGCGDAAGPDAPACDESACAAQGMLCDADVCVEPWRWGSPAWPGCADNPRATAESLATKAAIYDDRAISLHVHPQLSWVLDVQLVAGADPVTATVADVAIWRSGENDGLWSALYLASQAYRYAVTRDADALANLDRLLDGERLRMRVTGVPGLFTRQLIPPGLSDIACPADPALYVPSPEKRGNKWVRIGDDGCAQVADAGTLQFVSTSHCGLADLAGYCFLDNVSQDEYVGHMFALGAIARLVDDEAVRDKAVAMLDEIGAHLTANAMEFVDWDGRATQWGKIHPGAYGDTPGYLAVMALSFLAVARDATAAAEVADAFDARVADHLGLLDEIALWEGDGGCVSNWNNISMVTANFHHLLWHERDPARRVILQDAWADEVMLHPVSRAALGQRNAWFNIMWAAQKRLGPGQGEHAVAEVADAVCQLHEFPASNHTVARDPAAVAPHSCDGRFGESLAAEPFSIADRCAATYAWWGNPYSRDGCTDAPELVQNPAGYLLPYWMARYYGFVGAEQ